MAYAILWRYKATCSTKQLDLQMKPSWKHLHLSHSTCTKQLMVFFCCAAGLERIQIVGSMNPATTVGRQPLAPRFAALMHVAYMGYPSPAHLQSVLSAMLASSLNKV